MLLVNESNFQEWLKTATTGAQLRQQQLQQLSQTFAAGGKVSVAKPDTAHKRNKTSRHALASGSGGTEVTSLGQWWDSIKSQAEGCEFQRTGSVAVIPIQGALEYHYSLWSWYYDSDCYKGIIAKVTEAANDNSIDTIVLNVHSPGGVHHGCPECAQAIWDARQKKEVIACVDYEAASAGYFLASQATRIVGLESGWVGSIGTQILLYSAAKMYQNEGFDIEVIRAAVSPDKNLGIAYEPISDAARKERQGWVDYCASSFIAAVARGRGVDEKTVKTKFGQGKMLFMPQAMELGMVDSLGCLDQTIMECCSSEDDDQGEGDGDGQSNDPYDRGKTRCQSDSAIDDAVEKAYKI